MGENQIIICIMSSFKQESKLSKQKKIIEHRELDIRKIERERVAGEKIQKKR